MARGSAGQVILAWPGECDTAVVRCPALGNGAKATGHAGYRGTRGFGAGRPTCLSSRENRGSLRRGSAGVRQASKRGTRSVPRRGRGAEAPGFHGGASAYRNAGSAAPTKNNTLFASGVPGRGGKCARSV